jgi:glutamate-ammonia-ligase adenylyltransferase
VLNLLEEIQFRDPVRSRPELVLLDRLTGPSLQIATALLPSLPNPDDALHYLKRLADETPEAAKRVAAQRNALRYALTIFAYSRFLGKAILQNPEWILEIAAAGDLHRGYLADEYEDQLQEFLAGRKPETAHFALFRRKQILRIVLRDALRFADLSETAEDLSNLADAVLNVAWRQVRAETASELGEPAVGVGGPPLFSVLALGKLGGRELNYSSDIDLMFLYSGVNDEPANPGVLTTKEFFKIAANRLTERLGSYSPEGLCYRVDLRLRPDGRYGEVCHSLEGAKKYYATRGRDWELQMLIKARVCAGDARPGRALLEFVQPLIYNSSTDFRTIEAVSETRARIHEKNQRRRNAGVDVKLAPGGIRDIEFLVQCLQRLHGGRDSWVRHGGTLLALSRLRDKEHLSVTEYARLASAYQFLRHLEHRLQFDEDRQTHSLPRSTEDLDLLARKMPAGLPGLPGLPGAGTLERELDHHFGSVQDLYERVIHSRYRPAADAAPVPAPTDEFNAEFNAEPEAPTAERSEFPSPNLRRYLEQRAPEFFRAILAAGIVRSRESFESFLEKVVAHPHWLEALDRNPDLARSVIDLFEHSRYFADQLVRHPELLSEVERACGEKQGRTGFTAPRDPGELRRFFREQMIRIQSDSVYHRAPIFKTLKRTSDLADSVIAAAYDIAVAEALVAAPPASRHYAPAGQMRVIALGRLGMREFDLASDADLAFLIPDEDAPETEFWTGVAERVINTIGAYTGDGVIFTIDTRLRPNGREGALVQTETAYKEYFDQRAEAWEGISWMKARAVAGNIEQATKFLNNLQELDWRRYGQGGRSRPELARMRVRLEREQGNRNPLKAGRGGFYDIDFALMYLRLKGGGLFFKVLNTPERIDIVEKMGHLEREDAEFLRDAAVFYRAIDHGLRVATGHAEGRLPTNQAQLAMLTELVHRWIPPALREGTLDFVLRRIRQQTRDYFERLFGRAN